MPTQPVPPFKKYGPSEADMVADQLRFYRAWQSEWIAGRALSVDGSVSYLFCYAYGVLLRPVAEAVRELDRLLDAYRLTEPMFADYCRLWCADCRVLQGDFAGALSLFPTPAVGAKSPYLADKILTLRMLVGQTPRAAELMALAGPAVTAWGKQHIDLVHAWVEATVSVQSEPSMLARLRDWSAKCHGSSFSVFEGAMSQTECSVPFFSFGRLPEAVAWVRSLIREAENTVREEQGIPRVGEGWVAETALYHELRKFFAPIPVVQHARPPWLGRQHLDIYFPSALVGVEYHGQQHDAPVEFFGGHKAWVAVRRRDAKKRRLCKANGVWLVEVRAPFSLAELIASLVAGCPRLAGGRGHERGVASRSDGR